MILTTHLSCSIKWMTPVPQCPFTTTAATHSDSLSQGNNLTCIQFNIQCYFTSINGHTSYLPLYAHIYTHKPNCVFFLENKQMKKKLKPAGSCNMNDQISRLVITVQCLKDHLRKTKSIHQRTIFICCTINNLKTHLCLNCRCYCGYYPKWFEHEKAQ